MDCLLFAFGETYQMLQGGARGAIVRQTLDRLKPDREGREVKTCCLIRKTMPPDALRCFERKTSIFQLLFPSRS